jgi:hypothetical protein
LIGHLLRQQGGTLSLAAWGRQAGHLELAVMPQAGDVGQQHSQLELMLHEVVAFEAGWKREADFVAVRRTGRSRHCQR